MTAQHVLQTQRTLPFSAEQIYAAFADPTQLAQWWGPNGFSNTFEAFDFRVGGEWHFVMHGPDGKNYANSCVFRELEAGKKVVIEHIPAPHFVLTIALEARGTETQISWVQQFDDEKTVAAVRAIAGPGNEQNLDRLHALLSRDLKKMTALSKLELTRNAAYSQLATAGGNINQLPDQFRNLILVDSAQALIDNGGLEYFFYHDFPSKPAYQIFIEAYRAIGAASAAEILSNATECFGIKQPELHIELRRKYIDSLGAQNNLENEFLRLSSSICGDDFIWMQLEKYAETIK